MRRMSATRREMRDLLLAVLFGMVALSCGEERSDPCKDGGQCVTLIRSYESLVEGDGCRTFYVTGECPHICANSLKSLIGRRTWARCARRCDWSVAITEAAESWLHMCLARPVAGAPRNINKSAASGNVTGVVDDSARLRSTHRNQSFRMRSRRFVKWFVGLVVAFITLTSIVVVASKYNKSPPRVVLRHAFARVSTSVSRSLQGMAFSSRARRGQGEFDTLPYRPDPRSLQRGARRHLKAMRAVLD